MEAVRLWCAHELAGRDSDADHTFRSVFAEVARPELPAGFARRVVAQLALEPEQRRRVPGRFAYIAAGVAAAVLSVALVVFGAVSLAPLLGGATGRPDELLGPWVRLVRTGTRHWGWDVDDPRPGGPRNRRDDYPAQRDADLRRV